MRCVDPRCWCALTPCTSRLTLPCAACPSESHLLPWLRGQHGAIARDICIEAVVARNYSSLAPVELTSCVGDRGHGYYCDSGALGCRSALWIPHLVGWRLGWRTHGDGNTVIPDHAGPGGRGFFGGARTSRRGLVRYRRSHLERAVTAHCIVRRGHGGDPARYGLRQGFRCIRGSARLGLELSDRAMACEQRRSTRGERHLGSVQRHRSNHRSGRRTAGSVQRQCRADALSAEQS